MSPAWVGNATESLKYLRRAFSRSPVGVGQRILQPGVFDRVLEQRQRRDESEGRMPLAAGAFVELPHGG